MIRYDLKVAGLAVAVLDCGEHYSSRRPGDVFLEVKDAGGSTVEAARFEHPLEAAAWFARRYPVEPGDVCAWCGRTIRWRLLRDRPDHGIASHGICLKCSRVIGLVSAA